MKEKISKWLSLLPVSAAFLIFFLSLVSFRREDFFLFSYPTSSVRNIIGIFGVYFSGFMLFLVGWACWVILIGLLLHILKKLDIFDSHGGIASNNYARILSFFLIIISSSVILGIFGTEQVRFVRSGIIGFVLSQTLLKYIGFWGTLIVSSLFLFVGLLLLWGYYLGELAKKGWSYFIDFWENKKQTWFSKDNQIDISKKDKRRLNRKIKLQIYNNNLPDSGIKEKAEKVISKEEVVPVKKAVKPREDVDQDETEQVVDGPVYNDAQYKLPSFDIIKSAPVVDDKKIKEDIESSALNLEETLSDFGISAKVETVQRGPVVTRYELLPSPGVKITRISSLADDIALSMKVAAVRIVAPIPGKGTVGVEVPNIVRNDVFLKNVVVDKSFINSSSKLTLALGKDVAGVPLVADLKEMPHLLIAGTTGSGKTVCVNAIISSMLFKAKPSEVKFILVDPKTVELASFVGIPHLISPIISNAKKAADVLIWATEEMEKRYSLLATQTARNIDAYNAKVSPKDRMPFIVIIVDELADLMIIARDKIETAILRLAQLSRAVGIHLILATQRPSVDVITGVIKANFPARISFKVASKVDSRTVLDFVGAEKLLGKGDLLFIRPGINKPIRAQACFVDDEDISKLVEEVKSQGVPEYNTNIMDLSKKTKTDIGSDDLLPEATRLVMETGQASASLIQRRLRVGYTRAARLLDLMEQEGHVGPFQGSKAREILIDRHKWLMENKVEDGID